MFVFIAGVIVGAIVMLLICADGTRFWMRCTTQLLNEGKIHEEDQR